MNLPESATVEDIESIYMEGWKLGLKALAVYRDNCKVGQPLSDARKKPAAAAAEPAATPHEVRPVRRRLPKNRTAVRDQLLRGRRRGLHDGVQVPG